MSHKRSLPYLLDFDNISFHNDFADQNQAIMSYSISTLLTRNLHEVFGENDPARRRAAIDEIFTEDCVFYDPTGGLYRGHDEIDRVAGAIKATHPDFRYQPIAEPEELGNGGRIQWVSGRPGEAPAYAGTDFIIARDSRIAALYLFFEATLSCWTLSCDVSFMCQRRLAGRAPKILERFERGEFKSVHAAHCRRL
jgi:SnoaL-like domain